VGGSASVDPTTPKVGPNPYSNRSNDVLESSLRHSQKGEIK
jgi:hypothetical protein